MSRPAWVETVVAGTPLIAVLSIEDVSHVLTTGETYHALGPLIEGLFQDRPHVSVVGDNGRPIVCYLSRFTLVEDYNNE